MIPENRSTKQYRYGHSEGYAARSQRRLQDDLGVDEAAAERSCTCAGKCLNYRQPFTSWKPSWPPISASQQMRLARYREVYFEATWIEVETEE